MPAENPRQSVPFEPKNSNKSRKSATKKGTPIVKPQTSSPAVAERDAGFIPEVVSQRMIRRVLVFCGIPIIMGMSIFIGSYLAIVNHLFKIPNTVVLLTSMGCLGLSVLGLSYGILSACWEEDETVKGSLLGVAEFKVNFGRMADAYRASKEMQSNDR
ncbi:PAM68 family protein [Chamaesiphon sp. VAR_48_metabat_135_sub]|jgi:Photosynthesis affected mutant 68|uniref:PAM68 family protein n=1 Tax=Chamaesiphon sp. VAR_48_metabat_135_sub TaxID=2964699 RepID=UPI00286CE8FD|nr:PAM68 family protein [Chamaesiphon sp. VAR_48_metabat_135_sub]